MSVFDVFNVFFLFLSLFFFDKSCKNVRDLLNSLSKSLFSKSFESNKLDAGILSYFALLFSSFITSVSLFF